MLTTRVEPQQARHHWTDWAGFLFFVCWTVILFRRTPVLGVMLLPIFINDAVVGIAFLTRRPAKARLEGWGPRIGTYGSCFLIPAFFALASWRYPTWIASAPAGWAVACYCVWTLGIVFDIWAVWHMRRSFSLAPQARELVRTGPYRFVRHPIYLTHLLKYVGIWLGHLTWPVTVAVLAWVVLIAIRVHYEEMVLQSTFPEYAKYCRQVGFFGPRLFSSGEDREQPAGLAPDTLSVSGASSPANCRGR